MKITTDPDLFETRARSFLLWLEKWITGSLDGETAGRSTGIDASDTLLSNLAALLDGTGNLMCGDKPMVPVLGFRLNGESAVAFGDGSIALHDLVSTEIGGDVEADSFEDDDGAGLPSGSEDRVVRVRFASGVAFNVDYWGDSEEFIDELGTQLDFLQNGGDVLEDTDLGQVVKERCPAFDAIARVEVFDDDEQLLQEIAGAGLADLTIEALGVRIAEEIGCKD